MKTLSIISTGVLVLLTSLATPTIAQNNGSANSSGNVGKSGGSASGQSGSSQPGHKSHHDKPMKLTANSALWERYLAAAQQAHKKQDKDLAKRYLFAALDQLEKTKPTKRQITPNISRLENSLLRLYPNIGRPRSDGDEAPASPGKLKMLEEEVAVMQRLDRLNRVYPTGTALLPQLVQTQWRIATKEIEETKAALESKSASDTAPATKAASGTKPADSTSN